MVHRQRRSESRRSVMEEGSRMRWCAESGRSEESVQRGCEGTERVEGCERAAGRWQGAGAGQSIEDVACQLG